VNSKSEDGGKKFENGKEKIGRREKGPFAATFDGQGEPGKRAEIRKERSVSKQVREK
jgi:hypothetical protein